jgi:RHS repeat-associated protein
LPGGFEFALSWHSVALQQIAQYSNGTTYFIHPDTLGTTRVVTNMSASVADSYDYMPFGEQFNGGSTTQFKFGGMYGDSETNLYHTPARQYPAAQGRWLSPDPLAGKISNPQSLNRYSYVGNSPLIFTDPTGLYRSDYWDPTHTPCTFLANDNKNGSDHKAQSSSSSGGPGGPSADESEESAPEPQCVSEQFNPNHFIGDLFAFYDGFDSSSLLFGPTTNSNPIVDMGPPGAISTSGGTTAGIDTVAFQADSDPTGGLLLGGLLQYGFIASDDKYGICDLSGNCTGHAGGNPPVQNPFAVLDLIKGLMTLQDATMAKFWSGQTAGLPTPGLGTQPIPPSGPPAPAPPSPTPLPPTQLLGLLGIRSGVPATLHVLSMAAAVPF